MPHWPTLHAANAVSADWDKSGVLRTRVLTALVIFAIGLIGLFALPPVGFAILAGAVLPLLGGWEAARLAGVDHPAGRWAFGIALGLTAFLIYRAALAPDGLLAAGCGLWLVNLAWLSVPARGRSPKPLMIAFKLAVLALVLLVAWLALVQLQALSPWLVLLLFVIIAAADTGAYFSGRHFGGARLAPTISPGKTRAGALGGLAAAIILTPLAAQILPDIPFSVLAAMLLAFLLALISIGGDLFISLLKRQRGLKDTSSLLPGHGGILDRFDSMSAVLPFFTLAVLNEAGLLIS
jgi:phosphatidate cytidylyltransferase